MSPNAETPPEGEVRDDHHDEQPENDRNPDKKRTRPPNKRKQPPKTQREGTRKSSRTTKSQPSQLQLLKYMLSYDCESLCRPEDEQKAPHSAKPSNDMVTYTSGVMSPFQELTCAVVLSRPISHMLGLRTIRTIFNAPYELTTAKKMAEAGNEKLHKVMWDARTQHKGKTADQLHYLADFILEYYAGDGDEDGSRLKKVTDRDDVQAALDEIASGVKGMGPTASKIFRRRVQWLWPAAYPFIDDRSAKGLREMGLPDGEDDLRTFVEENWSDCQDDKYQLAGKDEDEKARRAFVIVLERATSATLEGKTDQIMQAASAMGE